jgi:hypothetical protein
MAFPQQSQFTCKGTGIARKLLKKYIFCHLPCTNKTQKGFFALVNQAFCASSQDTEASRRQIE